MWIEFNKIKKVLSGTVKVKINDSIEEIKEGSIG